MKDMTRREFVKLLGFATALPAAGYFSTSSANPQARVVVIGGGFGGATCAKYLKRYDPDLEVTLVEQQAKYVTCPFSNTVLGGLHDMNFITHTYDKLHTNHKISVVHDRALNINPSAHTVSLKNGKTLAYDRLVLSPGIDFKWGAIEGYDQPTAEIMPHAWKAGPQTVLLRKQLEKMPDGGRVIIVAPGNPFRCPPGPYERASLMAYYFKAHKPKSKILILDAKDKFSKQPLFQDAWEELYPGMIEWMPGSQGGKVSRVNTKKMSVYADDYEYKGDVINVVPPQKAGEIAHQTDLVDGTGWCPVNQITFESKKHKDIHVIGDASIAGKMPKSGFSANSQAKVCAAAIVLALRGQDITSPSWANTCYSLIAPDYGISVAAVYAASPSGIAKVEGSGGVSPREAPLSLRRREAVYAEGWYNAITQDVFT
jgi:sulfide dehydrogenase [flavocytochrome c] flavoprotein subunit